MEQIINTEHLTQYYTLGHAKLKVVGVEDINLTINEGDLMVLKGESGSGKSTLLALLAGLDSPTSGRIVVDGNDITKASEKELNAYRRDMVGIVFQAFNLLPTLSVFENVCLPALLAGKPKKSIEEKAHKWLDWLGLTERLKHYPAELSGGEMQRTAISRCLINEPSIILADEPTGNLDSVNGQNVIELLAELSHRFGRTVIIATHSSLADPYASKMIRLKDGRVVESSL